MLCSSDKVRPGVALFRFLSQALRYATLLPAVHPSVSSLSSNTKHLLQIGDFHLKHLHLVSTKQEQLSHFHHDVSNDFLFYAIPGREIGFVQRMLVRGRDSVWQMGEYAFLWYLPSPSHLNQLFCNLHDLWIEFSACLEWRLLKRRTTVALSDLASRTYARVELINLSRI